MINGDDVLKPRIKTELASILELPESSSESPTIESIIETSLSIDDKDKTKTDETKIVEIVVTPINKTWCGC
jgi:hypothetical protein